MHTNPFSPSALSLRGHAWLSTLWRAGLAVLLCCLTAVLPAQAQGRGGDEGDYQILQARYGTAAYNVDVTQRLKELARADRTFRMGNATFGVDPVPGVKKTLRIFARGRDGQTRTFEYTEGSYVDGAQFIAWGKGDWGHGGWQGGWGDAGGGHRDGDQGEYQILQANYGTAERHVDVTQRLKELARSDANFRTSNDTFGVDPDPGHRKVLRIYARGRDGQSRVFEYTEGSRVDGNLFTGWGGGNWGQGGWGSVGPERPGHRNERNEHGERGGRRADNLVILRAVYGTGDRQVDVSSRLRSLEFNERIDVQVENSTLGIDPAPGQRKSLWVTYSLGGREYQVQVREFERLSIP